jgi:hypothetical protein
MASTNWSTQKFFETVCRTAGGKSDSFIDPVMKRWLELKERLTIGTNESLSGVGPSTHAVKPNPDMDKEIIALILIPCAICDQQYLCSDCQDDPECDWPYQCLEDEFCTECGRLITFWEWDADPSEYEYDPSESEDDYSESSDKESGWSDGL